MGSLFSFFLSYVWPNKQYKVVIVGLDNAGKTTILYKLHLGEVVCTTPTVGANTEEVTYRNVKFECWDLGGQQALRASWSSYYKHTDAVVLVVDSTDAARMGLVQAELVRLLGAEELAGAAVCVFANKQDLRDALRTAELTDALGLHAVRSHEWTVQPCCALTGEGLDDGLGWITSRVTGTQLVVSTGATAGGAKT